MSGETAKNIEFVTHDDNVDEPDGSFTITLTSSTNYTLGSTSSVTIRVTDNDDLPAYSIAAVADSVLEDSPAQFRVTSPTASLSLVTIRVNVAQTGDVITDTVGNTTTTIAALATEKTISISTDDDEVDEVDGSITVTLLADVNTTATYTIATDSSQNSATITVLDNDEPLPVISLSTNTLSVTEGANSNDDAYI